MQSRYRIFAFLGLLLTASTNLAAQDNEDASVLGALSDSPPREIVVRGHRVLLYEFARNELLRQSNRHREVTYYYVAQPHLQRSNGKVLVQAFPGISDPAMEIAQVTIEPAQITGDDVYAAMGVESVDAYAQRSRLLPLHLYGLEVKFADLPMVRVVHENAAAFTDPVSVSWTLARGGANRIRNAFDAGGSAQVGYLTLVKLSQVRSTRITWGDVKSTKAFRDYTGPSGPKLLTAAQVVDMATSVLTELRVFHWQELSASEGGASAREYGAQLQSVIDRVIDRRQRKEAEFETWLDAMRVAVPVDRWQAMVDETRKVAIDAKNLDHDEWCKKYRNELETLSKTSVTGSDSTSGGLDVTIPVIKVPIGLSFSDSGSDSTYSEDQYRSLASSEDCGKKIVENNFKYDWDGIKYEPKSIFVYERLSTSGNITDSEIYDVYTLRQRIGRNTWSVK